MDVSMFHERMFASNANGCGGNGKLLLRFVIIWIFPTKTIATFFHALFIHCTFHLQMKNGMWLHFTKN